MKRSALLLPLLALAWPITLLAGNSSVIRSPLEDVGDDSAAHGTVRAVLKAKSSVLAVDVSHLEPKHSYELKVGDVVEAAFTTDSQGRGRVTFTTAGGKHKSVLDFDPRGQTVSVVDDSGARVLAAVVSGEGEPAGTVVDERANLQAGAGVKGAAAVRYQAQKKGRRTFEVAAAGVDAASLELFVDGIDRGALAVSKRKARATFRSDATGAQLLLDFDPRGAQIDLIGDDGVLRYTGKLEAMAKGVNFATRSTRGAVIPATAAAASGHAEAKLRLRDDARQDFSVEVENVPAGDYDFLVNDTVQGTISVTAATAGGTKGELEFSSKQDDDFSHEAALLFDPVGATLTVRQGSTVFFTGIFNPSAGTTAPAPGSGTESEVTEALASTGLDADATASAEFSLSASGETEFEVEIEDVPAGKYQLVVGGTLRGTIAAAATASGSVRGALKFTKAGASEDRSHAAAHGSDDPAGDDHGGGHSGGDPATPRAALKFDPRGQLIEVKSAAGTYFSHVFGDGSAPATGGNGTATVPGRLKVALLSSGADADATAQAEWERDDRGGESFEVEVEDLNAGAYELVVGGTVRGNITVSATEHGTRGVIKFEDHATAPALPLDFDPLGQAILIRQNGVTYFQRDFPAGS